MTAPITVRLLYLGRNTNLVCQLDATLHEEAARYASARPCPLHLAHVTSQKQALERMRAQPCHGIFLEIDSRPNSRHRFCTILRNRHPNLCIIAVCKEPPHSHQFAFDAYILRPFVAEQARPALRKVLHGSDQTRFMVGPIQLDTATRTVWGPRGKRKLAPKLCSLLSLLMANVGITVKRETIMLAVWETEFLEDTRTLDVHIRWLRERIEPDPSHPIYLLTVRGEGYLLDVPS